MSTTKIASQPVPVAKDRRRKSIASTTSNSVYLSALNDNGDGPDDTAETKEEIQLTPDELEELKKSEGYKTGLFGSIAVIICVVVGAGIFINPQDAFVQVKSTGIALLIYASLGIHTTVGAICFAELGTTFPVSGGDYAYINEAFGSFVAFLYQSSANFVFIPCVNAILAQAAGKYLLALICTTTYDHSKPENKFTCGLEPEAMKWTEISIGIVFIIIATVASCFNSRYTKKLDEIFMVGKLLGCALVIVLGIYQMIGTAVSPAYYKFNLPLDMEIRTVQYNCSLNITIEPEFGQPEAPLKEFMNYIHAVYFGSFSYLGWNYLNFLTKELRNPARDLPLAIGISVPLVTVLYLLMNVGYMAVLPGKDFICTKAMAYDTLNAVVGAKHESKVGWIATLFVILAAVGGLFGHMDASCRLTVAGAQNHHWPSIFEQVHVTQLSPIPAVIFQGIMSLGYAIIVGLLHPYAILMSVYTENTFSAVVVAGLIRMRHKRPDLVRPIKLWIVVPYFYCICAGFLFLVPIVDLVYEGINSGSGKDKYKAFYLQLFVVGVPIIVVLISIITFIVCISKRPWPKLLLKSNDLLTRMFKKVCRLKKLD